MGSTTLGDATFYGVDCERNASILIQFPAQTVMNQQAVVVGWHDAVNGFVEQGLEACHLLFDGLLELAIARGRDTSPIGQVMI